MTEILGTIYSNMSEDFQSGILPISRCLKAGNHDTAVVYKVGQTQSDNPVTWGGLQEHQTPRSDGVSPTLTAAMGMGGGQTPIFTERNDSVGKVGQISSEGSQCGSVFSDDGNMGTLTAGTHGNGNPHICTQYRIRKLTPRECWRLMSFTDEDFDKAAAVNSNTQLYKQAGNSIVKNVLMAIFGQMIPGKENVYKEGMVEHGEEKKL
jgi:site-specific DNA-cytosine methylase